MSRTFLEAASLLWMLHVHRCVAETISEIYGDELRSHQSYFDTGPYGSTRGGEWFTDFWQSLDGSRMQPIHWPDGINIRHGERIDSIQLLYGSYHGGHHGGEGGTLERLRLYNGDRVTRVTGRRGVGPGAGIDQLTFHTKNDHRLGPFGGSGGYPFDARPPFSDCYLAWISGRAYLRLDSITFHWRCPVKFVQDAEVPYEQAISHGHAPGVVWTLNWLTFVMHSFSSKMLW